MKLFPLASGASIPAIGLGTWQGSNAELSEAVKCAINVGYRHIDAAAVYVNEIGVGQGVKEILAQKKIKREDLFITSKLWNSYHLPKDVLPALKSSLSDLQLNYLDLYLIHWPVAYQPRVGLGMAEKGDDYIPLSKIPLRETWQAMEQLVSLGLVKSIGVSNFSIKQLSEILPHAKVPISVNQVENHPFLSQEELIQFCHKNKIHVTAYSPLGSPNKPHEFKIKGEPTLLQNQALTEIAMKYSATPAQIALAWQFARGLSAIPQSINSQRIEQNFGAMQIKLAAEDMKKISALNINHRYLDGSFWTGNGSPYSINDFWHASA